MVLNATFNNISVISLQSVLLVKETVVIYEVVDLKEFDLCLLCLIDNRE